MEVTRRRGRRRKKLLDDLKDRRGYSHLNEEALDRTMWRNRFGRGFEPVVRQNTEWMNDDLSVPPFRINRAISKFYIRFFFNCNLNTKQHIVYAVSSVVLASQISQANKKGASSGLRNTRLPQVMFSMCVTWSPPFMTISIVVLYNLRRYRSAFNLLAPEFVI